MMQNFILRSFTHGAPYNALEAKYAKNPFQQNRYRVFDNHVIHKETVYNNEMGVNAKVLQWSGNSGVK